MRYEIVLTPKALEDLRRLEAHTRAAVRDAIETHLRYEPTKLSRSRIKRLRGLAKPQYRLRVEEIRVFYDVAEGTVEVHAILLKPLVNQWLQEVGVPIMKKVALTEIKDQLPRYLRIAEEEDVLITDDGRPAGVLIGFGSDEEWQDYQLENDPRFLKRIEESRREIREGLGVRLEDIEE